MGRAYPCGPTRTWPKFDREKKDAYTFVISVTDKGDSPRVTEVTLAVNITDVNDLPPVMDADKYVGKVAENTADGEIGVTVTVHFADLYYSMTCHGHSLLTPAYPN